MRALDGVVDVVRLVEVVLRVLSMLGRSRNRESSRLGTT